MDNGYRSESEKPNLSQTSGSLYSAYNGLLRIALVIKAPDRIVLRRDNCF